jgi:hypothetical protein
MVDDKGTVCIGTFGLRGAAGIDNAAASLSTAVKVFAGLQSIGLTASIGITSGKAYCGLVGSTNRHEYAVMGPSTNLSARLMCKAPSNGVICDMETKNRDRSHAFESLTEVTAKGYSQPVMTFKPVHEDLTPRDGRAPSIKFRSLDKSLGSEHSMKTCRNSREKLTRLADSDFYVVNNTHKAPKLDKSSSNSGKVNKESLMKLFGRSYEIHLIFNSLFIPAEDTVEKPSKVFDYCELARMVAICGSSGTGKTALMTAIFKRLMSVSKQDPSYNLVVMQCRQSGVHNNIPLYAWRPLILEMLRYFFHSGNSKLDLTIKAKLGKSSRPSVKFEYMAGFDIAMEKLPEFKSLRPLLLAILGLSLDVHDPMDDSSMSSGEKIKRCMDFVVELFCISAEYLRKCIFITM